MKNKTPNKQKAQQRPDPYRPRKKWNGRYPCPINHIDKDLLVSRTRGEITRHQMVAFGDFEAFKLADQFPDGIPHTVHKAHRMTIAMGWSVMNYSVAQCRRELRKRGGKV